MALPAHFALKCAVPQCLNSLDRRGGSTVYALPRKLDVGAGCGSAPRAWGSCLAAPVLAPPAAPVPLLAAAFGVVTDVAGLPRRVVLEPEAAAVPLLPAAAFGVVTDVAGLLT